MAIIIMATVAGCSPGVPPIVTIEPSQTAFLIPLTGQTSDQAKFNSAEFYENAKVPTKRISITQMVRKTGFFSSEWIDSVKLIIVERKPESRHWSLDNKTPITAESRESIAFEAGVACTAQIDETDAATFLYRYNDKPLAAIMDDEILNRIRSKFVEQCALYQLADLLNNKGKIMEIVREDVIPYFKTRGINITSVGLIGDFNYVNQDIQTAINRKFQAQQELIAQTAINEKNVSKALADAKAANILNNPNALKLKELEIQARAIDKWDGASPASVGGNTMFSMPFSKPEPAK